MGDQTLAAFRYGDFGSRQEQLISISGSTKFGVLPAVAYPVPNMRYDEAPISLVDPALSSTSSLNPPF